MEASPEGEKSRSKRKMKTAAQLQTLEAAYSEDAYPSESVRADLSLSLHLSDRQLQMWFCHRRLKDRKPATPPAAAPTPHEESKSFSTLQSQAVAFVEAQLGEPLRDDGPILGMEFESLPPDAFGAQIGLAMADQIFDSSDFKVTKGGARPLHQYQFIPEQPTYERLAVSYTSGASNAKTSLYIDGNEHTSTEYGFQSHFLLSVPGQHDIVPRKNSLANANVDSYHHTHPINQLENPFIASDRRVTDEEDVLRAERKLKAEEARVAREVEAHEKKIRKELEKQELLRRKREEQIRKEMEKHDRERRKEEERLMRERLREEERFQREQRRELERREKFLQKESIRTEKMKQREEMRREKEAVRLRAANVRAIARRFAKESTELIDDERLELMELAVSAMGLPSFLSLDYETLQNLDSYRDMQTSFPSNLVHLKIPFDYEPWIDSEENIGSLLMAWRFLIAFADVLGLWSFTLDEFVQAFHDYDPRLLGEIHICLLRIIIKDIEDIARSPSSGLGSSQTSAVGGGHPLIMEGAYAWGFDIRSWQRHLNPLTWPEILRQFALSAGLGPQLKRRSAERSHPRDDNDGNDGKNIICNLRSGAAVENAFAKMQERGFSNLRRSRHRLTPGTVKFAAFHVLSLEGEKGLTILEVADRIQKSGLRDLTTSKTPEASISAALSRDTKLFERTAPSTYCVRAAYRKDPLDAEAILTAARERIGILTGGFLDERDEDSDSDPELDDLAAETKEAQVSEYIVEASALIPLANGDERVQVKTTEKENRNVGEDSSAIFPESRRKADNIDSSLCEFHNVIGIVNDVPKLDQEDPYSNESNFGEPWVHGLMEGEYSHLTVEERLNALVALIGVAVEGNTIRLALEERLEAANALKKQMWAEMQIDKRRMKEEYVMRMALSPFTDVDDRNKERTENVDPPNEGTIHVHDVSAGVDNQLFQQPGYGVERPRSQLKAVTGHKAEEMYVYRSLPLGQDRRRNRYWQFVASYSQSDPGCGRIFVELHDGRWRLIDSEEGFDALMASLDVRGVRESYLHIMLQSIASLFKKAVRNMTVHGNKLKSDDVAESRTAVSLADAQMSELSTELGRNEKALKRYHDLERWIWKEIFSSPMLFATAKGKKRCHPVLDACDHCLAIYSLEESHCLYCHQTFYNPENHVRFPYHVAECREIVKARKNVSVQASHAFPVRVRLLKLLLSSIEVCVPLEALETPWIDDHRKSWAKRLSSSSSSLDLLQVLTILESSMKREFLCSDFETSNELLGGRRYDSSDATLPWVPLTTAAVALRAMEFDAAIFYTLQQKLDSQDIIKDSSRHDVIVDKTPLNDDMVGTPHPNGDLGIGRKTGRRGKKRGLITRRGASGSRGKASNAILSEELAWKSGRGRKRSRRRAQKRSVESGLDEANLQMEIPKIPVPSPVQAWGAEEGSSSGRSEFDDENAQQLEDEYDEFAYGFNCNKSGDVERTDYNMDRIEDDDNDEDEVVGEEKNDDDEVAREEEQNYMEVGGYSEEGRNMDVDLSSSSGYSE